MSKQLVVADSVNNVNNVIGVASNSLIPVIAFAIYFCGLMC
jgi:hypothetical protein